MKFPAWCKRFHDWAEDELPFLGLLGTLLVLRIPNLAEPYWYGDEAIYLTIGNALRAGLTLYKETVDHKTPIIYLLAMVPSQFWFRILLLGWMMVSTHFFWSIAKKLFTPRLAWIMSFIFVVATSIPAFEGNIPNGELFVMGFVLAGLWLLSHTPLLEKQPWSEWTTRARALVFGAGVMGGLAVLTKVPAILDVAALASIPVFLFLSGWRKRLPWLKLIEVIALFIGGMLAPILASVLIFWTIGALPDYWQFGLAYNLHYSGNWSLPFSHPALQFAFSLPGKALVLFGAYFLAIIHAIYHRTWKVGWLFGWFWATVFAALLSNRPYPHYFMQVLPPFILLVAAVIERPKDRLWAAVTASSFGIVVLILWALQFRLYPTTEYYVKYFRYLTGQISTQEYHSSFNSLVAQNEKIAKIIMENSDPKDRIFIWGTNPMLYALTQRVPSGKFTVAFHIHDLKVYDETIQAIRDTQPSYIIMMKGEARFPELEQIIAESYPYVTETDNMTLYRRANHLSTFLLQ